jgi:ATP-dependent protease ClpP protease subunit
MRIIYPNRAGTIQNRTAVNAAWKFEVRNAQGPVADVFIYDEISEFGVTADAFQATLAGVTSKEINLHVHSPGGNVFDGIAIYNALRSHPAHVTARVEGLAASAASVIIQAADRRVMMKHSQMMIHNTRAFIDNVSAADMDDIKDLLHRQDMVLAGIYHERTRGGARKLEKILQAMAAETWFTDAEAVAFGLADTVESPKFQGAPVEPDEGGDYPPDPDGVDDLAAEGGSDGFDAELATLIAELSDDLPALPEALV